MMDAKGVKKDQIVSAFKVLCACVVVNDMGFEYMRGMDVRVSARAYTHTEEEGARNTHTEKGKARKGEGA